MAWADQNVLIPLKVDAFVLNETVCDGGHEKGAVASTSKIAPISQPNYSFLRLKESYLQPDILNDVDLHNASPATSNARIRDLGTGSLRENRQGVYLHWTLPRAYRSGTAVTTDADSDKRGLPEYPEVPTRWLVIRHIHDLGTVKPPEAREKLEPVTAWVVESDRCRTLDGERDPVSGRLKRPGDIVPDTSDLQVDVSPFISPAAKSSDEEKSILNKQAEVFIGDKIDASRWAETAPMDGTPDTKKARVNLQLLNSSNELFPDYQPHCSNVFSIVDNFQYGTTPDKPAYASHVSASYFILGWHSKEPKDIVQPGTKSREERLKVLNMAIKGHPIVRPDKAPKEIADWFNNDLAKDKPTRSLCHGAMYDVTWDNKTAPAHVLADKYAALLTGTLPVAVGTTPMDALMTYAGSHEKIDRGTPQEVEAALKRIEAALLSRDDGVEAHAQAADMMYNWNYLRLDGGELYHVSGSGKGGGRPTLPDGKQRRLSDINNSCRLRDAADRKLKRQRWAVFSEWWKAVTLAKKEDHVGRDLNPIFESIKDLVKQKERYQQDIKAMVGEEKGKDEFQPGVHDPFLQHRDPTLLVGGVHSGWEPDYLLKLLVRLDCQVLQPNVQGGDADNKLDEGEWAPLFDIVEKRMPHQLRSSVTALIREFIILRTRRDPEKDDGLLKLPSILSEQGLMTTVAGQKRLSEEPPEPPELTPEIPVFHDLLGLDYEEEMCWRDAWNDTQPWFPLFLEWEVEYTHIDHEDWELTESRWWHSEGAKLHYAIKKEVDLGTKYGTDGKGNANDEGPVDRRRYSGRVLILPQPSFSLEAKIAQLFLDTLPTELDKYLKFPEREKLQKDLNKLSFLSAPLSGFNSHLLTVDQGNHVKPAIRDPMTGKLRFMSEAQRDKAGLDSKTLPEMDIETDLTPYGNTRRGMGTGGPAAFKPVTHGQFRITKLNIIDKFGQAIHAVDPTPSPDPPRLWPCISDWYAPQALDEEGKIPKVVRQFITKSESRDESDSDDEDQRKKCEFIQVPPQLNQPARLNTVFAMPCQTHDSPSASVHSQKLLQAPGSRVEKPFWQAANDWDQPIWGWVVINYANASLQFFLPSGAFYREVRRAGPKGAQLSPEWLPFKEPDNPDHRGGKEDGGVAAKQLARLVLELANQPSYLKGFMAMVTAATATQSAAPSAYAEFRSALLGRPLALTHIGLSLELAGPAWETQLTNDGTPAKALYPKDSTGGGPSKRRETNPDYEDEYYRFPVKLGDHERSFDGLVGYFLPKDTPEPGDALDLSTIYTHFHPKSVLATAELCKWASSRMPSLSTDCLITAAAKSIVGITKHNYPRLAPYYIDPDTLDAESYYNATNGRLRVFGALLDPFLSCHAYSGILPVKELILPNWSWQGALDRLSAFFHAGPMLIVQDVPDFDEDKQLKQGVLPPKVVEKGKGEKGVALPGGTLGQWSWLQPYMKQGHTLEKFMPLPIDRVDEAARLERGPYTAVEGYLQMAAAPNEEDPAH